MLEEAVTLEKKYCMPTERMGYHIRMGFCLVGGIEAEKNTISNWLPVHFLQVKELERLADSSS